VGFAILLCLQTMRAADSLQQIYSQVLKDQAKGDLDQALKLMNGYKPKQEESEDYNKILIQLYQIRGVKKFKATEIEASVQDFEAVVKLDPQRKAHHWQLGISYYYMKEYQKGKDLFELHQQVNPNDVENAVWHFICHAKLVGFDAAQKKLIPIVGDRRVPMMDIYELFSGRMTLAAFQQLIPKYSQVDSARNPSLLYTHLYLGLYHESLNQSQTSKSHFLKAVEIYKNYGQSHYMGDTAVTHAKLRQWLD